VNQSIEEVLKRIKIAEMTEVIESNGREAKKTLADLVTLT
jgi:hypothetical protein